MLKNKINFYKISGLILLLLIIFLFHFNHEFNSDDGIVLEGAWSLYNGKQIYMDFFEIVTPGSFYIILWLWKIFGVNYWVAKIFAMLSLLLGALGIYKISKIFTNNLNNYITPLLYILCSSYWPIIVYHNYNIVLIIWSTYFFIKAYDKRKYHFLYLSGFILGLSTLILQHKSILLFGGLTFFLLIQLIRSKDSIWIKKLFIYALSYVLPLLALLKWPANELYKNLIDFPLFHYSEIINTSKLLLLAFIIFNFFLMFLLRKEKNPKITILLFIQFILLASTYPLPDFFHITLVLFPTFSLLPIAISDLKRYNFFTDLIIIFIFSTSLSLAIMPSIMSFVSKPYINSAKKSSLLEAIANNCSESKYIYAGAFIPEIYFEARKLNPSPNSWLITNHHAPEQFEETAKMLEIKKPDCAVLNYSLVEKYNYNRNNPVDQYIFENYHLFDNYGDFMLYRLNN